MSSENKKSEFLEALFLGNEAENTEFDTTEIQIARLTLKGQRHAFSALKCYKDMLKLNLIINERYSEKYKILVELGNISLHKEDVITDVNNEIRDIKATIKDCKETIDDIKKNALKDLNDDIVDTQKELQCDCYSETFKAFMEDDIHILECLVTEFKQILNRYEKVLLDLKELAQKFEELHTHLLLEQEKEASKQKQVASPLKKHITVENSQKKTITLTGIAREKAQTYGLPTEGWERMSDFWKALDKRKKEKATYANSISSQVSTTQSSNVKSCPHCGATVKSNRYERHLAKCTKTKERFILTKGYTIWRKIKIDKHNFQPIIKEDKLTSNLKNKTIPSKKGSL